MSLTKTELYDPIRKAYIACQIALLADALEDYPLSASWADLAIDMADAGVKSTVLSLMSPISMAHLMVEGRIAECIDCIRQVEDSDQHGCPKPAPTRKPPTDEHPQASAGRKENWEYVGLVPLMLRLCTVWMDERPVAEDQARVAVLTCSQIARDASNSELWNQAARVLEDTFLKGDSPDLLVEKGNQSAKVSSILHTMYYVGASLRARPKMAIVLHMCVLPTVCARLEAFPAVHRIIMEYVTRYWLSTFNRQRFRFVAPSTVERDLVAASRSDRSVRVRNVLSAIICGLNVRIDRTQREWLEGRQNTVPDAPQT